MCVGRGFFGTSAKYLSSPDTMLGAGTCISTRNFLSARYKVLVGEQDWGLVAEDPNQGEYFIII